MLSLEPHLVDFAGLDALENGLREEKEAASKGEAAFRPGLCFPERNFGEGGYGMKLSFRWYGVDDR